MQRPRDLMHWHYATRGQRVALRIMLIFRPLLYVVVLGMIAVSRKF